ncbi:MULTISPECIES: DUF2147 domain-containing protein [Rhodanobacter]|nr:MULTISPECIES: DUF2147 domain-containing protein [Rhodanobacter]UJJ58858.1 DUF2147 domain-containing protein [Rhodanobacter denitrificans]UJM87609.1 DUF2147 domain-containing protein [Rhodanobacter denitrificans]
MKASILIFSLCLLCSCSKQLVTPTAANLSNNEASFIEYLASTVIDSVDGAPVSTGLKLGQSEPENVLKLSPGKHVLMINYWDQTGRIRGDVTLEVILQPGKRYWLAPTSATRTMKEGDQVSFTIKPMYSNTPSTADGTRADRNSPVGTWKSVDDETGKLVSIMQIIENNGELQAKMLKVLQSDDGPHPICSKCSGPRMNQLVEGMTIMWGVRQDHDLWDGGSIIDPHNGKAYKVKLWTIEDGTKLMVHGYTGFSLNGRTQMWLRQN